MSDTLASLAETEKLIIKQNIELLEAAAQNVANAVDMDALGALGETANTYDVYTDSGGKAHRVIEQSEACGMDGCIPTGRICCRPNHALQLHVFHPEASPDTPILKMDRPCKCGSCLPCCSACPAVSNICQQEMTVYTGDDQIAYIKQPFFGGGLSPELEIMDREDGMPIGTVKANAVCCIGGICCDHTFEVTDPNGESLGKIVKERPDNVAQFAKELGTDADNFTLYMNKEINTNTKAAIYSAMFLIDYMFFENEGDTNIDLVNQECTCKICDCYCCGCICPYSCSCGGGGGDDGDDGGYDGDD